MLILFTNDLNRDYSPRHPQRMLFFLFFVGSDSPFCTFNGAIEAGRDSGIDGCVLDCVDRFDRPLSEL
ncbi:hypothetical protein BGZ63DRAFT_391328 [Mariannaea sp. PMI_226]|nr:hypothetical protein BGZ63DRAFT_391328 [Mariannaea sp. PMI_226]